jgi:predicted ABC-type transport system involved in lysophospholipase L1 biosynthesis ATPase subunit
MHEGPPPERPNVLVRAENLTRVFPSGRGEIVALADASFTIERGQTVALVGPSGSGKSTLLHLAGGLDRPTSGCIEWPAFGSSEALRPGPVALAFQGRSLLPPLSVLENVELPILLAGGGESTARSAAGRMLLRFDLAGLAQKLPEELSGGEGQRVSVARALAGHPRLVLADEPTGQQDRATGARVINAMLATAAEDGAAVLVATHDPSVAERCSTQWIMERGRLRMPVAL